MERSAVSASMDFGYWNLPLLELLHLNLNRLLEIMACC